MIYWILDADKIPVRTSDSREWEKMYVSDARIVARAHIGDVRVSTVFLGIDHSFWEGPPLLFETMIFGGEHDHFQDRCSTWKQAEHMHEVACAMVRGNSW